MNAKTFFSDQPIAYHPILAKLFGSVTAALFLSQIAYWSDKGADPAGWIWKTERQMTQETGLSRSEQETARRVLKSHQVLREERRGTPARMFYLIDWSHLEALINSTPQSSCRKPAIKKQISRIQDAEKPQTIQRLPESNSETTTTSAVVDAASLISPKAKTPDEQKISLTFNLYQQLIGVINPRIAELIREDIEPVPIEWIQKAFDHMALANVRRWDYVKTTLQNWQASGGPRIKANGNGPPEEPRWSLVNGEWQPPSQEWVIAHLIGNETYAAGLTRLRTLQAQGVKT